MKVDQAIQEAIAYAESKGMIWYEGFSIEGSGFYNPANSTFGKAIFWESLVYHVDQLYDITQNDPYYSGGPIAFKIVKGPIEDEPNAWFGYVLY